MRNHISVMLFLFILTGCRGDDSNHRDSGTSDEENSSYEVPDRLGDYYHGINLSLRDNELYDEFAVHTIAKHTNFLSYTERHDYLYDADEDLDNSQNVVLVYSGDTRPKDEFQSPSNPNEKQTFNTEHIYPQSKLEGNAVADLHILRVVDREINGQRSNLPYTNGSGQYKLINGNSFYPGDEWKGDIARMIMYMNLRYNEPFDEVGNLGLFLEWNAEDPVSYFEIQRNEVIQRAQGNRNPFIDNPHLATSIWGGEAAENRWDGDNSEEDTEAPSIPKGISVTETSFETITLLWNESTDNHRIAKYQIWLDGAHYANVNDTKLSVKGLKPGTSYSFSVTAKDPAGNTSEEGKPIRATTLTDNQAPTMPSNLTIASVGANFIQLTWSPSTDNAGIQNYTIHSNGKPQQTETTTTATLAGLKSETTYSFTVSANDPYGNSSQLTPAVKATTAPQPEAGATAAALIISEYIEGASGYNKVLEIANISERTIDLTSYSLKKISNDDQNWDHEFMLEGILPSGEVLVLANRKADREGIRAAANILTDAPIVNFNGNDPIGLFHEGSLIDQLGFTGGTDFAKDVNLRRSPATTAPNVTFTPDEWAEFKDTNTAGLGSH